jgi:hypothetical protein
MDEKLINQTLEEYDITEDVSLQEIDVQVDDIQYEVQVEETIEEVVVESEPEVVIDVSESMGWVSGDNRYHDSLLGVDFPRQHPITSITNLREELDEIERLKTVYADGLNIANYYEWKDAAYDEYGYFVSLVPETSKIDLCVGSNIFGVSVESAGFIGAQDAKVPRGSTYGLIVTSGLVDVRCELDVEVGDYVTSNAYGYATKSHSNYGYKVFAKENKGGVEYAVIALGVQADVTNMLGEKLDEIDKRVDVNETNIISAINVANQAYNKASNVVISNKEMSDKVDNALGVVDKITTDVENMGSQVSNSALISAQAKAIAESAATSAESMRNEAVAEANKALKETTELRDQFSTMENQITDIEDQVTVVTKTINGRYKTVDTINGITKEETVVYYAKDTKKYYYYNYDIKNWAETTNPQEAGLHVAIAGIQVETDENSASINNLVSWQDDATTAMARIEQKADANGAYIQSTVSNMDKYTVGLYSQAYGFTRKQAQSVLEVGMIYVPTEDKTTEEYAGEGDLPTYTREFLQGYLYRWGEVSDGYGWITVDKDYSEDKLNTSAPAVYFSKTIAPSVADSNDFGYWYTNGNTLTGTAEGYEPHTLYKWSTYTTKDENGENITKSCWIPIATLAGNSSNRAVSQIRQDANTVVAEVTNARGDAASLGVRISNTETEVQSLASWTKDKDGNQYNLATIQQTANDAGASIAQVVEAVGQDGEVNAASIVTAVTEDKSSIKLLANNITLDASQITLNGETTFTTPDKSDGTTKINGAHIATGTITSTKISADAVRSNNYQTSNGVPIIPTTQPPYSTNGTFLNLKDGAIYSKQFTITPSGDAYFNGRLSANALRSNNYAIDGDGNPIIPSTSPPYSGAGTFFNLDDGAIYSKNFVIDNDGDVYIKGDVTAENGYIANWKIATNTLTCGKVGLSSAGNTDNAIRIYAGSTNANSAPFRVTNGGGMFATNGEIGGWEILETGIRSGTCGMFSSHQYTMKSFSKNRSEKYSPCFGAGRIYKSNSYEFTNLSSSDFPYMKKTFSIDVGNTEDLYFCEQYTVSDYVFTNTDSGSQYSIDATFSITSSMDSYTQKKRITITVTLAADSEGENPLSSGSTGVSDVWSLWFVVQGVHLYESMFMVLQDGSFRADGGVLRDVTWDGEIAGFNARGNAGFSSKCTINGSKYGVKLLNHNTANNYVLAVGPYKTDTIDDAPFRVDKEGKLYVENADVDDAKVGTLSASASISTPTLWTTEIKSNNENGLVYIDNLAFRSKIVVCNSEGAKLGEGLTCSAEISAKINGSFETYTLYFKNGILCSVELE